MSGPTAENTDRSRYVRGVFWAVMTAVSFAVMMIAIHYFGGRFDAFELVFVRATVGLVLIVPVVSRNGLRALKTKRFPMHVVRALFALFAMATLYYALAEIGVAEATVLTFLIPLFTTVAAGTVLGEKVGPHRWAATIVGFCGALVIIRPGIIHLNPPILLAVLSSVLYAGAWSSVKILTRTDAPAVTVFWMNFLMLPLSGIALIFVWVTPRWDDVLPLLIMAVAGWSAWFCQARTFANAEASAVMPFDFLRLPLTALLGWGMFSETVDIWTWIGGAIIFTAGYYITLRETRRNRKKPAAA